MKYILKRAPAAAAMAVALCLQGFGMEVFNTEQKPVIEKASLSVDGRLQFFGLGQVVKDPHRNDGRLFLFLKQARLRFHGNIEDVRYNTQLAFAGEDEVKSGQNASLNLLDFDFDLPLHNAVRLKVGQFKVPYSRERLTNGGQQLFAERSFGNLAWRVGRDVGGAVYAKGDNFAGTLGVFTGGGRDVPERFLPEKLGIPMTVLRVGYDDGVGQDLFDIDSTIGTTDRPRMAAYVNALWTQDTLIGHSVVLGVKTSEIPLILNKNWNPYLAKAPLDPGSLVQVGGDWVFKAPLGGATVMASAEGNYAAYKNTYGRIDISGGTGMVGVAKGKVELATRYTYLNLGKKVTPGGGRFILTDNRPLQEVAPSLTYHVKKGRSKVLFDFPVLFDVPVVVEKGLGSYVITEQPDQVTLIKTAGNTLRRRTVVEGRMIYQLSF
jgi:hypothetical protein